jgi:hypothetical protein
LLGILLLRFPRYLAKTKLQTSPSLERWCRLRRVGELIKQIKETTGICKDSALQRVVVLLKSIDSVETLRKEKGLIDRICIDSVENWDTDIVVYQKLHNEKITDFETPQRIKAILQKFVDSK